MNLLDTVEKWEQQIITDFKDFINKCTLFEESEYSEIYRISGFIEDQRFYLNLVFYFHKLFKNCDINQAKELSLWAYIYLRSIIAFDGLIDKKINSKGKCFSFYKQGFVFLEEASKRLSWLIPKNSDFWSAFEELKKNYLFGIQYEHMLGRGDIPFTEEAFNTLAAYKTDLVKSVIEGLSYLSGDFTNRQVLLSCLTTLHIGFQYCDDVNDFKKDIQNNQKTYAIYRVEEYLKEQSIDYTQMDVDIIFKYFFISGIATQHLHKAKEKMEESLELVSFLPVEDFTRYVENEINEINKKIMSIDQLTMKAKEKAILSYQKKSQPAGVINAIQDAVIFVKKKQNEEGLWKDFLTSKGFGSYWVSTFIGFHLTEGGIKDPCIELTAQNILNNYENAGSFNESSEPDGDSIGFKIGFLKLINKIDSLTPTQRKEWFHFKNENGAYTTYRSTPPEGRINTWSMEHLCVTAAASLFLSYFNDLENEFNETIMYLLQNQSSDGRWASYWWSSDVYATSFALQSLMRKQTENNLPDNDWREKSVEAGLSWLCKTQKNNGCWPSGFKSDASAFYTALALKPLILSGKEKYKNHIKSGIDWLLRNQMADGSWQTVRKLRVPDKQVLNTDSIQWIEGAYGTNRLVDDFSRVFTCSVIVNTLLFYQQNILTGSLTNSEYSNIP